jgi:hypothetical protein
MLSGRYRDACRAWRPNLVVDGAFALLASLLKREPGTQGLLFWAVGAGEAGWDAEPPSPQRRDTALHDEIRRVAIPPEAIRYVDARGAETAGPAAHLEVGLEFAWPDEAVTLREFGLFGGDAGEEAGSGTLINRVIHPRIDLEPGQRLTRELRLSFARGIGAQPVRLSGHWLGDAAPRVIEGVGARYGPALEAAGIGSVEALAHSEPHATPGGIPVLVAITLRAKARLALRTASALSAPEALAPMTVSHVLRTPASALASSTGIPEADAAEAQERLAALELALDHAFLGRMTLAAVVGGAA